jgi:selenocysteine lyase/cysteine desulfurase
VHSNTGAVAPVAEIVRLCRAADAISVIDIAQSAGVVPLALDTLDADVVIGSCIKWLCGGPGAAFLWLRPGLAERLTPSAVGWFSHENPFEMDIRSFRYAPGALRFWGGTPSVAPYVCAAASLRVIERIGVRNVFAHNRELVAAFRAALPREWQGRIDAGRMGGTICLDVGDQVAPVRERLLAEQARFDVRGTTLRLSFHVFNTVEQAGRLGRACFPGSR